MGLMRSLVDLPVAGSFKGPLTESRRESRMVDEQALASELRS